MLIIANLLCEFGSISASCFVKLMIAKLTHTFKVRFVVSLIYDLMVLLDLIFLFLLEICFSLHFKTHWLFLNSLLCHKLEIQHCTRHTKFNNNIGCFSYPIVMSCSGNNSNKTTFWINAWVRYGDHAKVCLDEVLISVNIFCKEQVSYWKVSKKYSFNSPLIYKLWKLNTFLII